MLLLQIVDQRCCISDHHLFARARQLRDQDSLRIAFNEKPVFDLADVALCGFKDIMVHQLNSGGSVVERHEIRAQ